MNILKTYSNYIKTLSDSYDSLRSISFELVKTEAGLVETHSDSGKFGPSWDEDLRRLVRAVCESFGIYIDFKNIHLGAVDIHSILFRVVYHTFTLFSLTQNYIVTKAN